MHKSSGSSSTGPHFGRATQLTNLDARLGDNVHLATVSNHNSNSNIISGPVGTLVNNNPVTNIIYRDKTEESDAIQVKISTILKPRHVVRAVYGAQIEKGCMKGTRVQLLREIEAWIKDPRGPQVFWLAGMAGTGKSAIAWTVCARADDDPMIVLGGSFFCSRSTGLSSQRDVRCVVPTLAQLLALQSTEFAEALASELKVNPGVLDQQIELQIEKLLYKPLYALKDSPVPVVFVIDALDECGSQLSDNGVLDDVETHRIVSDMLEALVTFSTSEFRLPVKFFVTSRPETHIRDTHVSDVAFSKVLRLHTVDKEQITADIQLYISNRLFATPTLRALFTQDDVTTLARLCDGLFIVASTALGHTLAGGPDVAAARFKSLLDAPRDRLSVGAAARLDHMYAVIVEEAAKDDEVATDKLETLLRIFAALLCTRMTLSITALADILDLPTGQLRASMTRLHAVISVPDEDGDASLRLIHASFGDYLIGRASSRIRVSELLGHEALAHGCLHLLEKRLHFNISHSHSSFESNMTAQPRNIPLSLEYACMQWIYHVSALLELSATDTKLKTSLGSRLLSWIRRSPRESHQSMIDDKVAKVIRPRLLFWLEVMSVLGQVQRAAAMLMFAAATVQAKELSRFLRDANSFVASSQEAIMRSAPHIYLSALPFAEKDSLVYQDFAPLCAGLVSIELIGISHHAGRLMMTLTGHDNAVNSVAYTLDSRLLASASTDGTVRIWDMRTGEEITTPLRDGSGAVCSVAFAPNGKDVVSGTEDGVVCVWNSVETHGSAHSLNGHSGAVSSVLYSPSGSCLASASSDNTVRLWSTETKQQIVLLSSHIGRVHALAFSPDGLTLATGSEERGIQLWDVATSKLRHQSSHDQPVHSLCFSPDGRKIGAGWGHDAILCNARNGRKIAVLHASSNPVLSVDISPDGLSLVSVYGKSVCLSTLPRFRVKTSAVVLDGHTETIRSAVFSPNELYIATASDDRTVRIWNASGDSGVLPATQDNTLHPALSDLIMSDSRTLSGHKGMVVSAAVSPTGTFIVSGSDDRSVRIWDAETGAATLHPLLGHTDLVTSVAISFDGRLIASASYDRTIRLWDARSGSPIGQPMQGHTARVTAVVFSPDAQRLASGSEDKTVRVWDAGEQRVVKPGPLSCNSTVRAVAFSSKGQLIAAGDDSGYITIWQSATGQSARDPLQTHLALLYSIGFSPDEACIVSGGRHSTLERVRIWSISTGDQVLVLTGHTEDVNSVAYSPDGRFIVSGSDDRTVRLWDAATGAAIAVLAGHTRLVSSVAFMPDGRFLVSASHDKTIRIWDLTGAPGSHLIGDGHAAPQLHSAPLRNGWLLGPSGELLLWVPAQYHQFLKKLKGSPRNILLSVEDRGWHHGQSWTSCWRNYSTSRTM